MFRHILMPLDGSRLAEVAVSCTLVFAKAFGARVTLLRVMENTVTDDCLSPIDPLEWDMCKKAARSYMEGLVSRFEKEGITAEYVLMEGKPAQRILEFINETDNDLIIVSSHGRSGLSGWNAGSVLQKVIARARISFMIIRAYREGIDPDLSIEFKKIFIPLDGSRRSEYVLPPATTLASFLDARLILAHVVPRPEMPRFAPPNPEDLELADRIVEHNHEEMRKHFEVLKSRLPVEVQTRLITAEDTAPRLHELINEENADLVIMSAHGYSGRTHWGYGGITATFIEYGTTPLLIMQDVPPDQIEPSAAEKAAAQKKGH